MNNLFSTLATLAVSILLVSCDGSPDDSLAGDAGTKTDSGLAGQPGTCPVPGPDQTSTPAKAGKLGYLVSNGPVVCQSGFSTSIVWKGIPCSDIAGNLKTPANTPALPYGPCCVGVVQDTADSRVTPLDVLCEGADMSTPGMNNTTQYALCSTAGAFLGWVCPPT